jgi:lipopolysaccharide export system permease protein
MRILDRYVTREFGRLFLLFTLAAPLLFVLGDWTDNVDTFTERQIPITQVVLSYMFQMPLFILYSIPIAGLIATVFTVSNMTRHSEMAAAKASGISFHRAIIMLPLLGLVLSVGGLALSEVVPITLRRAAELRGDREAVQVSRSDFVYPSAEGWVLSVRQLDPDRGRIHGLAIEREGDRETRPDVHLIADQAVWDSTAGGWTLMNGLVRLFFPPDFDERLIRYETMTLTGFDETPEQLLATPKEPDEMRYEELGRFIEILERSGGEPYQLRTEQAARLAIPAATFIIILFGAPLANAQARGGPAFGIGISLGITMVYLLLFRLSEALGGAGTIDPVLAVWLPNILFLVLAFLLILRTRS